jgi:PST family polysaccharide transporter/lipopolysaccharide exporter
VALLLALIAGMMAGNIASLIVSYWMVPRRPRFMLKSSRDLFSFSGWVALNNAITFMRNRAGDLIIGRIAGTRMLGLFNVAYEISNLPPPRWSRRSIARCSRLRAARD